MRVEITTEAGARLGFLAFSCGGLSSVIGVITEWTMALFGVPMIVALAAVAGVGLVVSYQDRVGALRMAITVLCTIIVACAAAVFGIEYGGLPKGGGALIAALTGAVLQIFLPALIKGAPAYLDKLISAAADRIRGRQAPPVQPDQLEERDQP